MNIVDNYLEMIENIEFNENIKESDDGLVIENTEKNNEKNDQ